MSYTVDELQKLMESFEKSGLTRFRYSTQEETLELRNEPGANHSAAVSAGSAGNREAFVKPESSEAGAPAGSAELRGEKSGVRTEASPGEKAGSEDESAEDTVAVRAPLAGIFYRAAGPGQKPYVEEGQSVKKGDIVGLVEAMKMMNEIPSPCDGIIREIRAEDAAFTGYDAVLMTIGEN